jgi:hypothetical protein
VRDQHNNIVKSFNADITLTASGSAKPDDQVANIVEGISSVVIKNTVVETIEVGLEDTESTGLDVTSTRSIKFTAPPLPPIFEITIDQTDEIIVGHPVKVFAILKNGVQRSVTETDITAKAYLVSFERSKPIVVAPNPNPNPYFKPFDLDGGVGTATFTTEQVGIIDLYVMADDEFGCDESQTKNVTYFAEAPFAFLISTSSDSATVNEGIDIRVTVQDIYSNPAVVTGLELDVLATGFKTGSALEDLTPIVSAGTTSGVDLRNSGTNPQRLTFVEGEPAVVRFTSTVTDEVTITLANPSPAVNEVGQNMDIDATTVLSYNAGKMHRIVFQPPPTETTVDTDHTLTIKATDFFYNMLENKNLTALVTIADGVNNDQTVEVQIKNGLGSFQLNRKYPCSIVATLGTVSGVDTSSKATFAIVSGETTRYVIIDPNNGSPNDPTASGSVDTSVTVQIEARDQYDNVAATETRDVTLVVSGSAEFMSGSGEADIILGVAIVEITNTVAETIELSLSDTNSTRKDLTSTQNVRIYWGATVKYIVEELAVSQAFVDETLKVVVQAKDQYDNTVGSEGRGVTIAVNGSGSVSAVTDTSDPSELLNVTQGVADIYVTSAVVGPVTISLVDSESTGMDVSSTQIASFVSIKDVQTDSNCRTCTIVLAPEEMFEIQKLLNMATDPLDTKLALQTNVVLDLAGNPLVGPSDPINVSDYQEDLTPPRLQRFDLIMDTNSLKLILTFMEAVNVDTLYPPLITLQSSQSNAEFKRTLVATEVSADTGNDEVVTLTISDTDLVAIRAQFVEGQPGNVGRGLARHKADTFLSMKRGTVLDMVDLENIAIDKENAFTVNEYRVDLVSPAAINFTLDLNEGELYLTYSETIDTAHFNSSKITIQDNGVDPRISLAVEAERFEVVSSSVVNVKFKTAFFNKMKSLAEIATSKVNSFISVKINLVTDSFGNLADPIGAFNALAASTIIADTTVANIVDFELNMNTSMLTLYFDEPVNGSSIRPTEIIFQGTVDGTGDDNYQLTGGETSTEFSVTATIDLTYTDMTTIKYLTSICSSKATTFITLVERLIQTVVKIPFGNEVIERTVTVGAYPSLVAMDMAGNGVKHIQASAALQVGKFTSDYGETSITHFDVHMDDGTLTFTFTEPVNAESFDGTKLRITAANSEDGGSGDNHHSLRGFPSMYLSGGKIEQLAPRVLKVTIMQGDLDTLKGLDACSAQAYAFGTDDCFISHTRELVRDNAGVLISERRLDDALVVSHYEKDQTEPETAEFVAFDLNTGTISVLFSETILRSSFKIETVSLQTNPLFSGSTDGLNVVTLSSGDIDDSDSPGVSITFTMAHTDLNRVREEATVCAVSTQCYLVLTASTAVDMSGNFLQPTSHKYPGIPVANFAVDNVRPAISSYALNMQDHTITLSFTESVDGSTLDPKVITMQSKSNSTGNRDPETVTFSGGDASRNRADTIILDITSTDSNRLAARHIAESEDTTYLSITSTLVKDCAYSPNDIIPIETDNALSVMGNYTYDATNPTLTHFSLNLNEERGLLTLTFSEPVVPSNFDPKSIVLQRDSIAIADTPYYRLTGGDLAEESDIKYTSFEFAIRTITLVLTKADQTALKTMGRDNGLASDTEKTYLSVDSTLVTDAAENAVTEIAPIGSELPALKITGELEIDDRYAVVKSVQLDLDMKVLIIEFDDVIQANTLKVHAITIQSGATTPALSYDLKTSSTHSDDGYIIAISLSAADELALNRIEGLASEEGNTYVALRATAFKDVKGENIVAIFNGMQVTACTVCDGAQSLAGFTADTTPPTLDEFDLDLSTGVMTMRFSEAVDLATFMPNAIVLSEAPNWAEGAPRDSSSGSTGSGEVSEQVSTVQLTGGLELMANDDQTAVTFTLVKADLDELKRIDGFATSQNNTYVSHDKTMVSDMFGDFGVAVAPIESGFAKRVTTFVEDDIRPSLELFWIDMDAAELYLSFTEPIRLNTISIASNIGFVEGASADYASVMIGEGAIATTVDSLTVVVKISAMDMNRIKVADLLFSSLSSSYITISHRLIKDMNNNMVNIITPAGSLLASSYKVDLTPPVLDTFAVNMNLGTIQFNFDEPVRVSTINLPGSVWAQRSAEYVLGEDQYGIQHSCNMHNEAKCTSQDNDCCADIATGEPQTCSDGYYAHASGPGCTFECRKFCGENALQIILTLDETELNVLKQLDELFTKKEDTYMRFANDFVRDMAGVAMVEITLSDAKRASVYFDDSTRPEINSFDLDMSSEPGILTLSFSETVDISTLNIDKLALQPAFDHVGDGAVSLTSGFVATLDDGTSVSIILRKDDFDLLKLNRVGISKDNTWLTARDGAIQDMAGTLSLARENGVTAKQVAKLVEDTVRPRMEKFDLNLHDGTLGLHFSEPVDAESFNPASFRLQDTRSQP